MGAAAPINLEPTQTEGTSLEAFPPEIIQHIARLLPSSALDPLAATCTSMRGAMALVLKDHWALRDHYAVSTIGKGEKHGELSDLLITVLKQPEVCYYIRELNVKGWEKGPPVDDNTWGPYWVDSLPWETEEDSADLARAELINSRSLEQ